MMRTTGGGAVASELPGRLRLHPHTLTILATYRCTAACRHCCFDSSPRLRRRLKLEEILGFINEGARSPALQLVAFSGGECFLLGADLERAITFATSLGLRTRCVTNGYWAKTPEAARARLRPLHRAGLREINVSTGDFHQQFVTHQAVVNAATASVDVGMEHTVIMIELQKTRRVTRESFVQDDRIQELCRRGVLEIIESPWMPMDHAKTIAQPEGELLNRNNLHHRGGCPSVLTTLVITPERRLGYCCGLTRELIPSLNGSWQEGALDHLVEEGGQDFMKIWLHVDGPERILAWAASKDARIQWEDRYAHSCHACLALFRDPVVRAAIQHHYQERVIDVLMRYTMELRTLEAAADPTVVGSPGEY